MGRARWWWTTHHRPQGGAVRHLRLVSDAAPVEPVQMGFDLEDLPNADVAFKDLPKHMQFDFDAHIDAVPGRRESMARIDSYSADLSGLLEGLDPLERAKAAVTAYVDADGTVRSRHLQMGVAPAV